MFNDPLANLLGAWSSSISAGSVIFRIFLSLLFSAVIGCERSSKRHSAGLRTFMLFSFGGTVAMLADLFLSGGQTLTPILSGATVLGSAFLAVNNVLYSAKSQIKGLTTSAALFVCAIIGVAFGAGLYTVGAVSALALLLCLNIFPQLERFLKNRSNHFEMHLELTDPATLQAFVKTVRELGIVIDNIEANPAYHGCGLYAWTVSVSVQSEELKKYKSHGDIVIALRTLPYVSFLEEIR